jgi:hypothetical protein
MMKSVYTIIGYYLLGMLLLGACSDEENVSSSALHKEGEIVLSSTRAHVITRSGDLVENFKVGTLYRLYAFLSSDSQTYDWTSTTYLNGSLGRETETEDGDREIVYGLDINKEEGIARNYPKNGSLDLYGVTFGSEVDPQSVNVQQEGKRPVWHIAFPSVKDAEIDGTEEMPDLMFSNNKRGASVADGKVSMRFKHALSLLKFNVVWEEQAEGSKAKYDLEKVQVRKIEVLDLHKEGDFDMVSGAWSYAENSKYSRTYYENQEGLSKPEKSYSYTFNDSIRIFPNQKDEAIKIRVTLYDGNTDKECEVVREYPLTNNGSDLVLESNYVYQITIMLLTNDVRVMVLLPTVYEWNDVSLAEEDVYLGQPVTFGGLMWMDRNLGAKTADAENDFYNSIGYYYQFGRNIPYIMDVDKFVYYVHDTNKNTINNKISVVMETAEDSGNPQNPYYYWSGYKKTDEIKEKLREYQVGCIYTFDHLGKRVTGSRVVVDGDPVAMINPGDVYQDENGKVDDAQTHELYKMTGYHVSGASNPYSTWHADMDYVRSLWSDVSNHPCPKGWRLPTADDLYAFMPRTDVTYTQYSSVIWDTGSYIRFTHNWVQTDEYTSDNSGAVYIEGQVGWYRKDTGDGNVQEIRFGRKETTVNGVSASYNVIYMIKNQGTDRAYRIRLMNHFAKAYKTDFVNEASFDPNSFSTNKRYITISRYTCDKDKTIDDYTQNGADETMWDNPIETLVYPCAGFIITDAYWYLSAFGSGIVLRTSEPYDQNLTKKTEYKAFSWVQYMATTVFDVGVIGTSRQSLGDQVRCVRDITAQ